MAYREKNDGGEQMAFSFYEEMAPKKSIAEREFDTEDDALDALLGLDGDTVLRYEDPHRGVGKRMLIEDDRLVGLRLAGETAAAQWLIDAVVGQREALALRRWLLAPLAKPPLSAPAKGRVVCSCLGVGEADIAAGIAGGDRLEALQGRLGCGTACGSCVPEIRRMIAAAAA